MGHQARLPLGATVAVHGAHRAMVRVGAFASVGMAGVDAVLAQTQAARIGLRQRSGLIISAPHADVLSVRRAALDIAGSQAHVSLLREVIVIRDAGEFLTRAQINTVLQTAAHQVGKPYVWGAAGPDSFDCSGLVQWSFAHAGIYLPRVSQQQWFAGPHISYANALPGDLLFWHYDPTDPADIDHVAIYAGNGMMLVAPHTGLNVEYVPVAMNSAFAGVVRVDPGMASQVG
ncbi:MAG: C40 family peptidase [Frankiales bacterium]|nr:C40 family peptidase [Frankiales bacterium]